MAMKRDLGHEVDGLKNQVAALRESVDALSEEITTGRVVVVDETGQQRVVLDARETYGAVVVRTDSPPGATTGIELYATGALGEQGPKMGLCVLRDGEVAVDQNFGGTQATG